MDKHEMHAHRPVRPVAMLAFDGADVLDICGPLDALGYSNLWLQARGLATESPYPIEILGTGSQSVTTRFGFEFRVNRHYSERTDPIDTLLVAGGDIETILRDEDLKAWLRLSACSVRRIASICTGAFLLAASGLLEGRRATTHWMYCERLAREYPSIQLEPDRIFVQDGSVYTSGGITSGIDLTLALIQDDWGQEIALLVAQTLVVFLKRPGGQSQFSALLENVAKHRGDFQHLQAWIASHLREDLNVERLAERMSMSSRNFARVFEREVGQSPGKFVEMLRVEAARCQLEQSRLPIEVIADQCGFGNPEHMRRAFQRRLKVSPSDYRLRFQSINLTDGVSGSYRQGLSEPAMSHRGEFRQ